MKKLRIYLDTSVISHLDAPDVPDKEADTQRLWEDIKAGKYEVVISDENIAEIEKCSEPKRSFMRSVLAEIDYDFAKKNDEIKRLSKLYVQVGGLPPKSSEDSLHIAIATVYGCNIILSWNFRHIVNLRAMTAVDSVNVKEGYSDVRILSPTMILEEGE